MRTPSQPGLAPDVTILSRQVDSTIRAGAELGALVVGVESALATAPTRPPAEIAARLSAIVGEVQATAKAVSDAVVAFQALALRPEPIDRSPEPYLALAASDLAAQIEEGRGRCSEIGLLYFGPDRSHRLCQHRA